MRLLSLLFLFSLSGNPSTGQAQSWVLPCKDSLLKAIRQMQRGESDAMRFAAGEIFDTIIRSYLSNDSDITHSPDFAPNIACIRPSDNSWRLLTWTIPTYDGEKYYYYGYLQRYNTKSNRYTLFRLTDSTDVIRKPESDKLYVDRWYGATYYEVISHKKKRTTYYTLCGWKGKDRKITQKVLEVLYFTDETPRLGYPLFKKEGVFKSRVVFSFTSQATMSLRYEPARRMIIYDHLYVPKVSGSNDPSQAGPDGSYDGYRFKSGRWQWVGDIKLKVKPKSVR